MTDSVEIFEEAEGKGHHTHQRHENSSQHDKRLWGRVGRGGGLPLPFGPKSLTIVNGT